MTCWPRNIITCFLTTSRRLLQLHRCSTQHFQSSMDEQSHSLFHLHGCKRSLQVSAEDEDLPSVTVCSTRNVSEAQVAPAFNQWLSLNSETEDYRRWYMCSCSYAVQWSLVFCSEIHWCPVFSSEIQWCRTFSSEIQWCLAFSSELQWKFTFPSKIQRNLVLSSKIQWSLVFSSELPFLALCASTVIQSETREFLWK